jgi:hypothetical protein
VFNTRPPILIGQSPPVFVSPVQVLPTPVVAPTPAAAEPAALVVSPSGGKEAAALQGEKYLQVKNASGKAMQVSLVYVADDGNGQGAWVPGDGEKPLTFTLKAGETVVLTTPDGAAIHTSRVRVWAETDAQQWLAYQSKDLVLVDQPYQASQPATFPLVFGGK